MSTPLQRVQHLLVTPNNPPTQVDGLDSQRCVELHNAILEHAWLSSGRSAGDFELACPPFYERAPEIIDEKCHPSLKTFFQGAREVAPGTNGFNFFYNVSSLNCAFDWHDYYAEEDDQVLNLYIVSEGLYSKPDGLVYDQQTHKAIMHFDITDDLEESQPWQPLESILSVWIEMIQRGKAVALHDDVCKVSYGQSDFQQDGNGDWQRIEGPQRDPTTGTIRIGQAPPWTIVPWTSQDLTESLELWATAVDLIERRLSLPPDAHEKGLVDPASLEAVPIPDGFAKQFILQAKKPRFNFIAPGLRLPTTDDFLKQPFMSALNPTEEVLEQITPPILMFRSETMVPTDSLSPWSFGYSDEGPKPAKCPSGLYLSRCDRTSGTPFEDGCELLIPFEFSIGIAKQSDLSDLRYAEPHQSLLQSGVNPFNQRHAVQLKGFLQIVVANLRAGEWTVDDAGVTGGLDVWKHADSDKWRNYWLPMGPGGIW